MREGVVMAGATSRVSRVLMTGPLAPFAEAYRRELRERGYTERSAVNQLRQVARFSRWLQIGELSVWELSAGRVEEFLDWQRTVGRHRSQWSRPGLVCLLDVLRKLGVAAASEQAQAASPGEVLLAGFGRYLAAERGLASGTVGGYVSHARRFLDGLPAGTGLAGVCAEEVTEAVLRQSVAVSVSATQFFVAGLRSFLRFCFIEGQLPVDLSQAALPVTGRRRSPLPRGISKATARALLGGCDRRSALGRRDGGRRAPAGRDRPGAAPPQPADHGCLRAGGPGPAAGPGRAMAGKRAAMSALSSHVEDYLRLRRALGFKLERAGQLLPQMVACLEAAGAGTVTSDLAIAWARLPDTTPNHWAQRLAIARGFARYLQALDPATEVPPPGVFPARRPRPAPYLFSQRDICRIL